MFFKSTTKHSGVGLQAHGYSSSVTLGSPPPLQKTENTESAIRTFPLLSRTYTKTFFVYASKSSELFHFLAQERLIFLPPIRAAIHITLVNKNEKPGN